MSYHCERLHYRFTGHHPAVRADRTIARVKGPLLLVDAPYLLYRAFFALPDKIKGADGKPVNALLGSVNAILSAAQDEAARATVCCMGPDAAPYRTDLYPAYHAHRPPMPRDLAQQWERAPALYEAMGWAGAYDPELEADDLLGAYALEEQAAGGEAVILTGDRDLFQCATDKVRVALLGGRGKKGPERIDPAEVRKRYGVDPEQVPDFIALRGDPSDGLPGAKGIGEKRAADILRRPARWRRRSRRPSRRRALNSLAGARPTSCAPSGTSPRCARPKVERPPDRATDRAGGAAAARELGMDRLAERLEKQAAA